MFDFTAAQLPAWLVAVGERVLAVLRYPVDPEQRIFGLYLLTSALFTAWVYVRRVPTEPDKHPSWRGLGRFLFPPAIWSQPSAWLDVRYFFFHQLVRLSIYGVFVTAVAALVAALLLMALGVDLARLPQVVKSASAAEGPSLVSGAGVALVVASVVLSDLVAYALHYAQHKVPVLWEFHKVHHSAPVMHPLTNYREHPIDNIAYAMGQGAVMGVVAAVALRWLGEQPVMPTVLGASLVTFVFNVLGYNLRHSHVWLAWRPHAMNRVFGSPAHHQVHHSCSPEHIDKNFAFLFPVWDVIFKTYCMPLDNRRVRYGLEGGGEEQYSSCLRLYWVPFSKVRARMRAGAVSTSEPLLQEPGSRAPL